MQLSRLLFLLGSTPFLVLGAIHAIETPLSAASRKGLSPRDPDVSSLLTRSVVRLTDRTDMWRAWIGFNLSHSLGAVLLGLFVLLLGRSPGSFAAEAGLALPLVTIIAGIYLGIGLRYWFRTPNLGIAAGLTCFGSATILYYLGL